MTKAGLAELIRDKKSGGDSSQAFKFHDLTIYEYADIARNTVIGQDYIQNRNTDSYDLSGELISSFKNVKIELDEDRDEFFSNLPARLVSLPNNRGLRGIYPMKDQQSEFRMIREGSQRVWSALDADFIDGRTEYYLEGNKVFYRRLDEACKNAGLLFKMVASIAHLEDDEQVPIPAALESVWIDETSRLLEEKRRTDEDNYNDSNTKLVP